MNGGVCSEIGNHFECSCINSYTGKLREDASCDTNPCGEGICLVSPTGYDCDCTMSMYYRDNCDYASCTGIDCSQNGQSYIVYSAGTTRMCSCMCDMGYGGSTYEHQGQTPWGTDCTIDGDCNSMRQSCDTTIGQCRCDTDMGCILDELQTL